MSDAITILKDRIDSLMEQKEQIIIAIDGYCTSGKTTLAACLAKVYDCNVFHMDDFFLRPEQRTQERYAQIGGNVDYERFKDEVLTPLKAGTAFSYRPFDCKTFTLSEPICVTPKKLSIIEGSYSMHPIFGDVYDFKIFLKVSPSVQLDRVYERPAHLHESFVNRWIPMENQYFLEYKIENSCDIVIDTSL